MEPPFEMQTSGFSGLGLQTEKPLARFSLPVKKLLIFGPSENRVGDRKMLYFLCTCPANFVKAAAAAR